MHDDDTAPDGSPRVINITIADVALSAVQIAATCADWAAKAKTCGTRCQYVAQAIAALAEARLCWHEAALLDAPPVKEPWQV